MPAPIPILAPSANTAQTAAAVTPSDSVFQAVPFRALWVGTTGNVSIQFADGSSVIFPNVPVGMLPVGGVRVNNTGTTAASLLAVY